MEDAVLPLVELGELLDGDVVAIGDQLEGVAALDLVDLTLTLRLPIGAPGWPALVVAGRAVVTTGSVTYAVGRMAIVVCAVASSPPPSHADRATTPSTLAPSVKNPSKAGQRWLPKDDARNLTISRP